MLGESLGERFLCSAQPFLPNLCLFRPTYYSRAGVKYVYVTRLSPGRPAAGARFSATNNVRQLPEKIAFNYSCIMQTRRLRYEPMNHYTTYPRFSLACLEPPSPADINPKSDKTQKRSKLCMPVSLRPSRGRRERERERERAREKLLLAETCRFAAELNSSRRRRHRRDIGPRQKVSILG